MSEVSDILAPLQVDDSVKAAAWDAFKNSADAGEFGKMISGIQIPDQVKATLWDLKKGISAAGDPSLTGEQKGGPVTRFATSIGEQLDPTPILKNPQLLADFGKQLLSHPIDTVAKMFGNAGAKAYLQAKSGDYAGAAGTVLGFYGPQAMSILNTAVKPKLDITPNPKLNAEQAAAIQWGKQNGIPMSLGTQTNRSVVQGTEALLRNMPGSAGVYDEARLAGSNALRAAIDQLAPGPKIEPDLAGASVIAPNGALQSRIRQADAEANTAYTELRNIAAQKATTQTTSQATRNLSYPILDQYGNAIKTKTVTKTRTLAGDVDMTPVKQWASPIVDQIEAEATRGLDKGQSAVQLANLRTTSPTYALLSRLMNTADHVNLAEGDMLLGELKGITRQTLEREQFSGIQNAMRNRAEGLASAAINPLSKQVDQAAMDLGPDATAALLKGREATKRKYQLNDMLQNFRENKDVSAFNRLIAPTNVDELSYIAQTAPEVLPGLATAAIQRMIERATSTQGTFSGAAASRQLKDMSAKTKKILFGGKTDEIAKAFRLADMMKIDANPSGSARVAALGATAGATGQALMTMNIPELAGIGAGLFTARQLAKKIYWGEPVTVSIPRTATGALALDQEINSAEK